MNEYPKFKLFELQNIFNQFPIKDKETINKFVQKCSISAGSHKVGNIKRVVVQFRHVINKSFNKITLDDLQKFLMLLNKSGRTKYTTNEIKSHIKRFLKWQFKDWSERFDNLKDIKCYADARNYEKINASTLPTKQDIENMFKAETNLFWKTFLILLYETGCRPSEIRLLTKNKVRLNVNGEITEIEIYATKTGKSRVVYISNGTPYLKELMKQNQSDYIFLSKQKENLPISKQSVNIWFNKLTFKVLGKKLYPYFLRHKRARELYVEMRNIKEGEASKFLGHNISMRKVYENMSKDDLEKVAGLIYQTDILPPEKKHELEIKIERLEKAFKLLGWTEDFEVKKSNPQFDKMISLMKILSGKVEQD